jgi:hypothetical protein
MFGCVPWGLWRQKPATPVPPPEYTITTAKSALLLTASRHGDTIVLCDDGKEVRRMSERQAHFLIARLAWALTDAS